MNQAFSLFVRLLAVSFAALGLASCGSGAVSGSAPVNDPTRITILPATATLFAGTPTTFTISGGTGSYIVSSSNQAVVPISGAISGNTLVVIPNAVGSDTDVTLTVRDTGTTPTASATLTVRPGTVANEITVTPSSTQGLSCSPAVCSGGDAEVSVLLSQAGAPIIGRVVRFDAITGDFRFVTSTSGSTIETLDTSVITVSDQTGRARARIRVLPNAANQTALLQVTDTTTGAFQRSSFAISQATGTSPGFFANPSSITFQGRRLEECAGTDITATFYVFGGTPPYFVANTISTLIVRPEVVLASGAGFSVTPTGACIGVPGVLITIRDSAGRTTSVSVANIPGTAAIPALVATPSTINLSSCDASANIQVAGGRSNTYFVASGSDALVAVISGSTVTVRRQNPSGPAAPTGSIGISDGTSVVNVAVTISGAALGRCPQGGSLTASPSRVTLSDCTNASQVTISGGAGTYTASSSTGSVSATVTGNVVSIRRNNPSAALPSDATVNVSDGSSSVAIPVVGTPTGAGTCGSGSSAITANPPSVILTSCSSSPSVVLSGGSGTYTATSNDTRIEAVSTGTNVLTIRRKATTPAMPASSTAYLVTVVDGGNFVSIPVDVQPGAAVACP